MRLYVHAHSCIRHENFSSIKTISKGTGYYTLPAAWPSWETHARLYHVNTLRWTVTTQALEHDGLVRLHEYKGLRPCMASIKWSDYAWFKLKQPHYIPNQALGLVVGSCFWTSPARVRALRASFCHFIAKISSPQHVRSMCLQLGHLIKP
ncbi:hypothetical protein VNO77_19493 [Canavalia gladiata]|uniref:Uncharacterized protein n=1 Tax=Canavalia gladiata TaxID=3824 RepID=A0AAN9LR15_CANGL